MKPQFSDASFVYFLAAMHCNFFLWYIIKPQTNQYKIKLQTTYTTQLRIGWSGLIKPILDIECYLRKERLHTNEPFIT